MPTNEELAEQLLQMQATLAKMSQPSSKLPIKDELYIVYNPHNVQVWCSKVDCPHLGRETKVDVIKQPIEPDLAKAMAAVGDEDIPETVEVPVLRVSEPRKNAHALGIMAVFGSELEATQYITKFYKRHRYDGLTDGLNLCIAQIDIT
jgi:hypothetical protein